MHGPAAEDDEDGSIAQINIIPLVDVVLVLLIIFMVTTVFAAEKALELDLPRGSRATQASQPPAEINVEVDTKGTILVNSQPTTIEKLHDKVLALRSSSRKTVLVLRGDKNVIYGRLMPVLDEVSRTGIEITLALKPGAR